MRTVGLVFDPDISGITDENGDICLDKMTVAQLKKFAKDNGIDIGSAARKDDIIQAITAAGDTEV